MSAVRARADQPMAPSRGPGRRLAGTKPGPPGRPCAPLTVQYRSCPPGARRHPSGWRLSIIDPQARRGAARVVGGRSPVERREARRRLRQRQAGLLRGQGKDPHPGDRRRPSVVGQPTLPTAQPAGEARTRDAATEAFVPEPPDRGRGNLSESYVP